MFVSERGILCSPQAIKNRQKRSLENCWDHYS